MSRTHRLKDSLPMEYITSPNFVIPTALAQLKQFCLYKLTPSLTQPNKRDKKPCDKYGRELKWSDNQTWLSAAEAASQAKSTGYGIGFIFTPQDNLFFIDIDNCLEANQWSDLACSVASQFNGAFIEISSSGTGLHIIGTGKMPIHRCRSKSHPNLEFYTRSRFCALTGTAAQGDAGKDFSHILPEFISQYFTDSPTSEMGASDGLHDLWARWEVALQEPPHAYCTYIESDQELLQLMLGQKSLNALFGGRASAEDLWNCNEDVLAKTYPPEKHDTFNRSAADAALIQLLCFYTGNDAPRIERLVRESALYRDKYERADYLPRTILKARGRQTTFYSKGFNSQRIVNPVVDNSNVDRRINNGDIDIASTSIVPPPPPPSQPLIPPPPMEGEANQPLPPLPLVKRDYSQLTENSKPANSSDNLQQLLNYFGITLRWNIMKHTAEMNIPGFSCFEDDRANAELCYVTDLASKNNFPITRLAELVDYIAQKDSYHPIREAILNNPWDGKPRLDEFIDSVSTETPAFSAKLLKLWLKGAIAAAFAIKGYSQQGVIVLGGKQGIKKTQWVKQLDPIDCGAIYEGAIIDPTNKDNVIYHSKHWISEIGEFDGTMRKTDIARLKSYTTADRDEIRMPYAKKSMTRYRRTAFIATVNDDRFLVDPTGNRRWWVLPVKTINDKHGLDVLQVWAEVYSEWQKEKKAWLEFDELAELEQANSEFCVINPLEEKLLAMFDWESDWKENAANRIEVYSTQVLDMLGYKNPSRSDATRMGVLLKQYGSFSRKTMKNNLMWVPKPKTIK